jgi:hypothetical protein
MLMYKRHPGEVHGHNWYFPNVKGTQEFPHVAMDVNYPREARTPWTWSWWSGRTRPP